MFETFVMDGGAAVALVVLAALSIALTVFWLAVPDDDAKDERAREHNESSLPARP